ncbi:hypothetical protein [Pararhodonellum marinum]|uniref:hypothetical protein n=1 Tax=Pararhodonellum marinum TaxID=2755358 RepID=UPI00188E40EF|nr:hypothetical protein [Pararhodonellum marinum]
MKLKFGLIAFALTAMAWSLSFQANSGCDTGIDGYCIVVNGSPAVCGNKTGEAKGDCKQSTGEVDS